jgi:hypothetical protein
MRLLLGRTWEEANPNSKWRGEALYWLSQAQNITGKTQQSHANFLAVTPMKKNQPCRRFNDSSVENNCSN